MRLYFLPLLYFASLAVAVAENVRFTAQIDDGRSIGEIISLHHSDGVNFCYLSPTLQGQLFQVVEGYVSTEINGNFAPMGYYEDYLAVGPAVEGVQFDFENNVLTNRTCWACPTDASRSDTATSKDTHVIRFTEENYIDAPMIGCQSVTLVKNAAEPFSGSVPEPNAAVSGFVPEPNTSVSGSVPEPYAAVSGSVSSPNTRPDSDSARGPAPTPEQPVYWNDRTITLTNCREPCSTSPTEVQPSPAGTTSNPVSSISPFEAEGAKVAVGAAGAAGIAGLIALLL